MSAITAKAQAASDFANLCEIEVLNPISLDVVFSASFNLLRSRLSDMVHRKFRQRRCLSIGL